MKLSVVIPLYNKAPFVKEAVESILVQDFPGMEIIIVDDGSTDGSQEVVKSMSDPRISFYQNEKNSGTAAIANKLINLSTGKYIIRLDADDIATENRIKLQVDFMEKNPEVVVSSGNIQCFGDDNALWKWPVQHDRLWAGVLFRSPLVQGASIINKELWVKNNFRYDENSLNIAEDWLMWYKVARKAKIANIDHTLIKYRVGTQNITSGQNNNFYEGRSYLFRYMFNDLGLPVEKTNIHFLTRPFFFKKPDREMLREYKEWLNYLHHFNKERNVFNEEHFNNELRTRWNQIFYHLPEHGKELVREFRKLNKGLSFSQLRFLISSRFRK